MSDYELTENDINLNIWISQAGSAVSLVLCTAVLLSAWWIYSRRTLRVMIDRVSFRLLLWSMAFEICYDIAYIAVGFYSYYSIAGPLCSAGVYFIVSTMSVVNYLCMFIAVNLMLTICFGLHPIKLGLERWYVGLSIGIGMFVPIIPAGLGHFGYDPILDVCWIQAGDDSTRLTYFIADLYFWQMLACFIASVSVLATLFTLFRRRRQTSDALFPGDKLDHTVISTTHPVQREDDPEKAAEKRCRVTAIRWLCPAEARKREGAARQGKICPARKQLGDRFLRIALRISCYPIALIFVNLIITIADLHFTKEGGVESKSAYGLYCIYYFLYGARGIVFASLAFFVDPCFLRAMRVAWRTRNTTNPTVPRFPLEIGQRDTSEMSFSEMLSTRSPAVEQGSRNGLPRHTGASVEKLVTVTPFGEIVDRNVFQALVDIEKGKGSGGSSLAVDDADEHLDSPHEMPSEEFLALRMASANRRKSSAISLDMSAALTRLAYEQRAALPSSPIPIDPPVASNNVPPTPGDGFPPVSPVRTKTFNGIMATHLPSEITDELDVVDLNRVAAVPSRRGSRTVDTSTHDGSAPPVFDQVFVPLTPPVMQSEEVGSTQGLRISFNTVRNIDSLPNERIARGDHAGPSTVGVGMTSESEGRRRGRLEAERRREEREDALRLFLEAKALL